MIRFYRHTWDTSSYWERALLCVSTVAAIVVVVIGAAIIWALPLLRFMAFAILFVFGPMLSIVWLLQKITEYRHARS